MKSDYPYQITEETKLGKLTFFVDQINKDRFDSTWARKFMITAYYNGAPWYMFADMSILYVMEEENHTLYYLEQCCLELAEYIIEALDLYVI